MKHKTVIVLLALAFATIGSLEAQDQTEFAHKIITVNVLGQVNNPSRFALPAGGTILDALATAGGSTKIANLSKVRIIHKKSGDEPDIAEVDVKKILNGSSTDIVLADGDTIYFNESWN